MTREVKEKFDQEQNTSLNTGLLLRKDYNQYLCTS